MCAQIYIKGRKEPIEVTNEVARSVKARWCGDVLTGAGKAEKDDILSLDDWAGEYGMIKMIELDKISAKAIDSETLIRNREDREAQEEKQKQVWIDTPAEKKAESLSHFKLAWSRYHDFRKDDPPQEALDKAYKIQVEYFRAHPSAVLVPSTEFGELLIRKTI